MNIKKREQRKLIIGGVVVLFLLGAVAVLASQLGVFKGDQRSKADGPCSMPANSPTEYYCANGLSYQHTCSGIQCAGDSTKICGTWGTETLGGNACGGTVGTGGGGGTPTPTGGTGGGGEPYGKNWGNACSGVGYGACNAGSRCVGGSQCGDYNCFKVDPSCGSATICTPGQCVKATTTTYRKCNLSGNGWNEYGTDSTCGGNVGGGGSCSSLSSSCVGVNATGSTQCTDNAGNTKWCCPTGKTLSQVNESWSCAAPTGGGGSCSSLSSSCVGVNATGSTQCTDNAGNTKWCCPSGQTLSQINLPPTNVMVWSCVTPRPTSTSTPTPTVTSRGGACLASGGTCQWFCRGVSNGYSDCPGVGGIFQTCCKK